MHRAGFRLGLRIYVLMSRASKCIQLFLLYSKSWCGMNANIILNFKDLKLRSPSALCTNLYHTINPPQRFYLVLLHVVSLLFGETKNNWEEMLWNGPIKTWLFRCCCNRDIKKLNYINIRSLVTQRLNITGINSWTYQLLSFFQLRIQDQLDFIRI